jgi:putative DNA primase/helicase
MVAGRSELLPVRPDGIPEELKARPQWVTWRLEKRDGDFTNVPYTPLTGRRASSTNLLTWGTFDDALADLRAGRRYDGIGFVFSSGDPYCGIDLDGCRGQAMYA